MLGDKWQSKTLFLAIFSPRSALVKSVFDCRLSGVNNVLLSSMKNYVVVSVILCGHGIMYPPFWQYTYQVKKGLNDGCLLKISLKKFNGHETPRK